MNLKTWSVNTTAAKVIKPEYYRSKGYKAEVTPYSGDYGVDVFAVKGKEKIAVQAKMYGSSSRKVCQPNFQGISLYFIH